MPVAPTPLRGGRVSDRFPFVLAAVAMLVVLTVGALFLVRSDFFGTSTNSSHVQGSGVPATQSRKLAAFGVVELAGNNDVAIRVGGRQSVVVHGDDNLLRHVTTSVRGDDLVIGNTPGSFTTTSPMSIQVTVPSLHALALTGSGTIDATGIKSDALGVTLSGSGVLRVSGRATQLDVALDGSGDARLEGLVARDVRAVVRGSGRILVTATRTLDASVPGSGPIVYGGDPTHVTTNVTGSGAVTRG